MTQSTAISFNPNTGWATTGIFWILVLAVLVVAKTIAIPIVCAIILALVLSPIRRGFNHVGLPSPLAAGLILLALGGLIILLAMLISETVAGSFPSFDQLVPDTTRKLEELTGLVEPVTRASEQIEAIAAQPSDVDEVVIRRGSLLSLLAEGTPQFFSMVVLTVTLTFFLLASGEMFYEKLVQVMPTLRDKTKAIAITRSIERHLSCYLLTITIINAGLGIAVGSAMWAVGMPNPVLFGLAAFILNYIPYLGALSGVAITFLIGLLAFETVGAAAIPALIYWFLTSFEGQILTPFLVGRRLKLNAVVVFISLAVCAWLWGFAGMILSTPMLIALKAFSDRIPQLGGLGTFLGQRETISRQDGLLLSRFIPYEEADVSQTADPIKTPST